MQNKKKILKTILDNYNLKLVKYEYYSKIFGNFNIEIIKQNQLHSFITDRGEIYHNSIMICDNSYHIAGEDDTFLKLVEVIKKELCLG